VPGARLRAIRPWALAAGLFGGLLLVLHGRFLLWPFISDDFVFLDASRRLDQLFSPFDVYKNYFRPVGRELYFYVGYKLAGYHPLPYHVFNFLVLLAVVLLVVGLGWRLAGPRAGFLAGASYALLYSHRLALAWVSCSQDLLAALFAMLSVHALLSGHRWRSGIAQLLAMLCKESVAAYPLVVALWKTFDAPQGTPWRLRAAAGARASAPLWAATAAWAAIVLTVRTLWHVWAKGEGTTLADVSLSAGSLWEGMRSALLSYVALEQPWGAMVRAFIAPHLPWVTLGMALAALLGVVWMSRSQAPPPTVCGSECWRWAYCGRCWARCPSRSWGITTARTTSRSRGSGLHWSRADCFVESHRVSRSSHLRRSLSWAKPRTA
jgi:hypothetical protein